MKLPSFLKGFTRLLSKKNNELVSGGTWVQAITGRGYSYEHVNPHEAYHDWVANAISLKADAVASSTYELFEIKPNKQKVLTEDHPVLTLLDDVNPYFTRFWLFQRLSAHLDLWGYEYWWIVRGSDKKPYEIYPLDPDRVVPVVDPKTYVSGYEYTPYKGGKKVIPFKDIIHFKEFNPFDDTQGLSVVDTASNIILADAYLNMWTKNYFKNNAIPDMVLEVPLELNADQVAQIKQDWINNYSGVNRRGVPAIMHSGTKLSAMQKSIADMQVVGLSNNNRDNILAMFRTSKNMVGIVEDVNLASARTTEAVYQKRAVLPRNINICVTLNEFLLYQFENDASSPIKKAPRFKFVPKLDVVADEETTRRNQIKFNDGIITVNEYRAAEGLTPLPGGDVFKNNYVPVNSEQDTQTTNSDLDADAQKKFEQLITRAFKEVKEGSLDTHATVNKRDELIARLQRQERMNTEEFEMKGITYKAKQDEFEKPYIEEIKTKVSQLFSEQIDRAIDDIDMPEKSIGNVLDEKKEIEGTIDLLKPIIAGIVSARGKQVLKEILGDSAEWSDSSDNVNNFIKGNTRLLAESMTSTTIEAIRGAMIQGFEAGEGIREIKDRIMKLTALGSERANLIAVTETHRASAFGELEAYKESKVVIAKIWYTAEDERVCPNCSSMNGVEVAIDSAFLTVNDIQDMGLKNYDGDITTANLHPLCRCTIIPVIQ